mmetsp:Transcript_32808/g.87018  ORF Transcript_32808/g.87018 Transcript_32808/m.87018 type:complete len:336 (-) Transcript_32808:590-1597(-)
MPLASMWNDTSIWGTPRGAGGMLEREKPPRRELSLTNCRSPWYTWMKTLGWLSTSVVKVLLLRAGIAWFRSMTGVMTPPVVSMPRVRGVTSMSTRSLKPPPPAMSAKSCPVRIPAWTVAPKATASSGLTSPLGSLPPKNSLSSCRTLGIRVDPPTRITSSTWRLVRPASLRTFWTGTRVRLKRSMQSSSNLARVMRSRRSLPALMSSTSTVACICVLSSRLASSHWRRSLAMADLSALVSATPVRVSNCFATCATSRLSKSSPPRCVSPLVASTSNTPLLTVSSDTSKVPPPRSKTRMFFICPPLSRPYAMAAAVGSLMMRKMSRPAILPAFFVA